MTLLLFSLLLLLLLPLLSSNYLIESFKFIFEWNWMFELNETLDLKKKTAKLQRFAYKRQSTATCCSDRSPWQRGGYGLGRTTVGAGVQSAAPVFLLLFNKNGRRVTCVVTHASDKNSRLSLYMAAICRRNIYRRQRALCSLVDASVAPNPLVNFDLIAYLYL